MSKKKRNITTFSIPLNIRMSFSGTEDDEDNLKRLVDKRKIKNKSKYLRLLLKRVLKEKGIKDFQELAELTPYFKKFEKSFKMDLQEYSSEETETNTNISKMISNKLKREVDKL